MGYAKYFEDDKKISTDRFFMKDYFKYDEEVKKIKMIRCPYCDNIFELKEKMFEHIRLSHNKLRPIIFINYSIVEDECYTSEIESVIIHRYGYKGNVLINRKKPKNDFDEFDILDISDEVREIFISKESCEISIGEKNVNIKRYSLNSINQEKIKSFIDDWNLSLANKKVLMFTDVKNSNLNHTEKRYLEGVYNYFVAYQTNNNDRYYEAETILSKFVPNNSLGMFIRKIVAFKMNWIERFIILCEQYDNFDDFSYVYNFFRNKKSETLLKENNREIYIEDELQELLNAIKAFCKHDYDLVDYYCKSHDVETISDTVLCDKILLLKSRMSEIKGDHKKSNYYLNEIEDEYLKQYVLERENINEY